MNGSQREALTKGIVLLAIAAVGIWALDSMSAMTTCLAILLLPFTAGFLIWGLGSIYVALSPSRKRKHGPGPDDFFGGNTLDGR